MELNEGVIAIIVAVFASGGFWAWINSRGKLRMLILGIGFRQIIETCNYYIDRGNISTEELAELNHYLFKPYQDLGGDGTAARLIKEVESLPLRKEK